MIAGKYKGHRLVSFDAKNIRPTTDRVKEDIFNMLSFNITNANILDLFSGTGSLGIEALSRGGRHVTFVDLHPKSLQILKSNLSKLEINKENYTIIKSESLKFIEKTELKDFQILLIDPPFTKSLADPVLQALAQKEDLNKCEFIFIESSKHEKIEDAYGDVIRLYKRKSYGDKYLSIYKCKGET